MPNDHYAGWPAPRAQYPWKQGDILIADELNAAIANAGHGGGLLLPDFLPAGQPDGTTDLAAYIQQAIDAAAGHGTLVIPANAHAYTIASVLIIPSNTHLVIEAGATIKVADHANQGVFVLAAFATHVIIELYGTLDGNLVNQEPYSSALVTPLNGLSAGISGGIGNTAVSNVYIVGNHQGLITSFKNWGFGLTSATNCEVNGVTIRDCGNTCDFSGITTRTNVVTGSSYNNPSRTLTLLTDPGVAAPGIAVGDVFTYVAGTDAGIGSFASFLSGEYVAMAGTSGRTIVTVIPVGALATEVGSCAIADGRVGKATKCHNVGYVNCVFDNIRDVASGFYGGVVGGYIRGCEYINHQGPGIFSDNGQPGINEDCEVSGCYSHDGLVGPSIISNTANIKQRNCRVVNNTVCNNLAGGILATSCNGLEVYGNTVHDNYPTLYAPTQISGQITVGSNSTRVSVWGNTVRDPRQSSTDQLVSHFCTPTVGSATYNPTTGAVAWTMSAAHKIAVGDRFYVNQMTGTGAFAQLNGWQTATTGTSGAVLCFTAATGLTLTAIQAAVRQSTLAVPSSHLVAGTYTSDASGNISLLTDVDHGLLVGDAFVLTNVVGSSGSAVAGNNLVGQFVATANTGITTTKTLNFVTTPSLSIPIASGLVLPANYGIAISSPDYCRISGNRIGDYQITRQMTACIGGVWGLNGGSDGNYFGPRNAIDPDVSSYAIGGVSGFNYDLVSGVGVVNANIDGTVTFRGTTGASSAPPGYYQPRGLTPAWNVHTGRGEVDFLLGEGAGSSGGFDFLQVAVIKPISLVSYDPATGIVSLTTDRAHTIQPGGAFVITLTGTDNNGGFDVFRMSGGYTAMTGTTGTTLIYTTARALSVLTITGGTVTPNGTGGGLIKTEVGLNGSLLANDGYGNTRLGGALVHGAMQSVALVNAGTVTVNPSTSFVLIQNATSIAAASIVLPATLSGQYATGAELELNFQNPVGALSWSGASVINPPTSIATPGTSVNFVLSGSTWRRRASDGNTAATGGPFLPLATGGTVSGPVTAPVDTSTVIATTTMSNRRLADRFADVVNVQDFGAVFDGTSHPLSNYYPTLAAAQAVYPHAVALTDEIDGVAIQAAINQCASRVVSYIGGGIVRLPAGTGCVNQPLVMATSSVSLIGQTEGFQFHSIFVNQPSSTTSLKWTGTPRTTSQGPVHFLTVKPDSNGRLNAGSSVRGILFDCNNIAGISGPLFLSCRYATINVGTRLPNGIAYPGAALTAGSQTITVSNTTGIPIGTSAVSASLPEGVTVATIVNATTLTVNAQATATSTETVTIGGEGIRFDVQGGLVDTNATQNLNIWFGGQQDLGAANATAPLMIAGGTGTTGAGGGGISWGNTSVCFFHDIYCVFNNGAAVVFNNSDHNIITNISGLKTGAGAGSLLVLNGQIDPVNNGCARFHKFGLVSGAGAIKVTGTDTGGFVKGSVGCVIDLLDAANGAAYPTIGVGASILVSTDMSTPALAAVGDDTQPYSYTAISAHAPDSTIRGGNNRGARAVDLQAAVRTAATQVASGQSSVIGGGVGNTASGTQSVVIGGSGNVASATGASVLGGVANSASQNYTVATGIGAVAELYAAVVHSGGNATAGRRALHTKQLLRASSAANTTPVRLTADALTASTINTCNLPYSDQANALSVQLIAIDSSAAANFYAWYQPIGLLRRAGTVAATVYVPGTPVILTNGTTAGIVITEAADTINGGYSLTFTPPTGNSVVWRVVATVEWTRVDGA